MIANKTQWISGAAMAFLGVGFVRLLAPMLSGAANTLIVVTGYLLVIVGITIVARATRRKDSTSVRGIADDASSAGS